MTLKGVMPLFCVISPNSVAFGGHYVIVVEDTPDTFCDGNVSFMAIFAEVTENECIIERHLRDPCQKAII